MLLGGPCRRMCVRQWWEDECWMLPGLRCLERLTEEPEQQGDGRCGLGLKMLREAG
eukprot:gene1688-5258_t